MRHVSLLGALTGRAPLAQPLEHPGLPTGTALCLAPLLCVEMRRDWAGARPNCERLEWRNPFLSVRSDYPVGSFPQRNGAQRGGGGRPAGKRAIISLKPYDVGWVLVGHRASARALSVSRCCDRSQRSSDWALPTPRGKWWCVSLVVALPQPEKSHGLRQLTHGLHQSTDPTPSFLQREYRAGGRTHTQPGCPTRVAPPAAARQLHLLTHATDTALHCLSSR